MNTLAIFRHGVYERNLRIDAVGTKAREVADVRKKASDDYNKLDLSSEGKEQAEILRAELMLAVGTFNLCLTSPFLRARTTAGIVFRNTTTPILKDENLRERDLGIFTDTPRQVFHEDYAESYAQKLRDPINWQPPKGETIRKVGNRGLVAVKRAESISDNDVTAFSSHADFMIAMRSRHELGGLTTPAKLKQPLSRDLQNPQWIQNCQVDLYTREDPTTSKISKDMAYFRSIATSGTEYDTGWLKIKR